MDKQFMYVRRFLNEGKGTAHIEAEVEVSVHGEHVSQNATLSLADCSRSVSLDFSFYDSAEGDDTYQSRLRKLNSLLNDLHAFRDALIASKKYYDKAKVESKRPATP
jgi:hypothetical protein